MSIVPNEVIIVEGRDDTKRLIETFGQSVKTIETNGSAVSRKLKQQIALAAETFGIIIFTDPDFQGQRIRRIVTEWVPNAKQAYLSQADATSHKKGASLGIEHAKPDAIRTALSNLMTPLAQVAPPIELADLVKLQLIAHPNASARRQQISEHFRLGHLNGKQLQKKLQQYGITYEQLVAVFNEERV